MVIKTNKTSLYYGHPVLLFFFQHTLVNYYGYDGKCTILFLVGFGFRKNVLEILVHPSKNLIIIFVVKLSPSPSKPIPSWGLRQPYYHNCGVGNHPPALYPTPRIIVLRSYRASASQKLVGSQRVNQLPAIRKLALTSAPLPPTHASRF